jgi:hypothetical protein
MRKTTRYAASFDRGARLEGRSRRMVECVGTPIVGLIGLAWLVLSAPNVEFELVPLAPTQLVQNHVQAARGGLLVGLRAHARAAVSPIAPDLAKSGPVDAFADHSSSTGAGAAPRGGQTPGQDAVARPLVALSAKATEAAPLPPRRPKELKLSTARDRGSARVRLASDGRTAPDDGEDGFLERFFGGASSVGRARPNGALAYAAAEPIGHGGNPLFNDEYSASLSKPYDRYTAVYDISARTVYLPDGTRLEAHSGLGAKLDDPRFVHVKMQGATPPHLYNLIPREALFHGVQALRLSPIGNGDLYGRDGLLAHTYMLGPKGDSNGCVSFRDYAAFLRAYQDGRVKRLLVVAHR